VPSFESYVRERYGYPKIKEMGSVLFFLKLKQAKLHLTDDQVSLIQRHFDAEVTDV
jgi:hypothetical protein